MTDNARIVREALIACGTILECDMADDLLHLTALETELATAKADLARARGTQAAQDVLAERRRQIEAEGWTPEHDDAHADGGLAHAAGCYAKRAAFPELNRHPPMTWPWEARWWKPGDRRRMLVKAGALILAEIERLDRAALAPEQKGE